VRKFKTQDYSRRRLRSAALRYAASLAGFAISFFVRQALHTWLFSISDHGLVVFLPAVLLSTYFAGLGPGIVTALLSIAAAGYFVSSRYHELGIGINGLVVLCIFTISCGIGIALVHSLRLTILRLDGERARAETLARERECAEQRIASDLRDMTQLNELSDRFSHEAGDVDGCLNLALDTAILIARGEKGNIQLFDSDLAGLTIAVHRGFDEPFLRYFKFVRDGASACAAAMRSAAQVIVEDVTSSDIFAGHPSQQILIDAGVRAVIATPLTASSKDALGMISIHFSKPYCPSERDIHFLTLLARQTADYLERRRAAEIQEKLMREVQHRSNNQLAVIQAIAGRSFSANYTLAQAREAFDGRLQALARANRQLSQSNWGNISLADVVRLELEPFAARVKMQGVGVMLQAQHAQSFSLALHELATNAAKYGALSNTMGTVEISWTVLREETTRKLKFRWLESGGPRVVAPTKHGFGSSLLKASFANVHINFATRGLSCEIDVPLGGGDEQIALPLELPTSSSAVA
jgi:two-component sensor histidine kinase